MKTKITFPAFLLILILIYPKSSQCQDITWPQFRGINSAGVATEHQDPPVNFNNDHNVIWKAELQTGQSSPCIWNDKLFITGYDSEENSLKMYCFDRLSGKINWERQVPVDSIEKVHTLSSPANATPATDGEMVVFYFSSFGLLSYDLQGNKLWALPLPIPVSRHGMGTSPIITGELVILNCFGYENDPCLLAINKFDGTITWRKSIPAPENTHPDSYSTPVVFDDALIINRSADVSAYDIQSGDQIWDYPIDVSDAICTPVIGNNVLYLTIFSTLGNPVMLDQFPDYTVIVNTYDKNEDNLLTREEIADFSFLIYPEKGEIPTNRITITDYFELWDVNKDNLLDSTDYASSLKFFESFHARDGIKAINLGGKGELGYNDILWAYPDHSPHITSPLYYKNRIYMVKSGGLLTCLDASTGELLFKERIGAPGAYFSSPIAANNKIYLASRNGVVTVLEAGDKLKILAKNDLDDFIEATPAIIDNKIYLRTSGLMYAFGN